MLLLYFHVSFSLGNVLDKDLKTFYVELSEKRLNSFKTKIFINDYYYLLRDFSLVLVTGFNTFLEFLKQAVERKSGLGRFLLSLVLLEICQNTK
jgi:hypothetical protein